MQELISKQDLAKALGLKPQNLIAHWVHKVAQLEQVNRLYQRVGDQQGLDFIQGVFDQLNVSVEAPESQLHRIPEKGPCVVVANHPFGALDGLAMIQTLSKRRSDIKVMANFVLSKIEPLHDYFIAVNPFENQTKRNNKTGVRACLDFVHQGGCLVVFPAGEVSTLEEGSWTTVSDRRWQSSVIKLIQRTNAHVVPVCFDGANSYWFHLLGKINPHLRTLALPSEMLKQKDRKIKMVIGKAIPAEEWSILEDTATLSRFLRAKVYALSSEVRVKKRFFQPNVLVRKRKAKDVAEPIPQTIILEELAHIEESKILVHGDFTVYLTKANHIPYLLDEIGRMREITFRAIGEGTGQSRDLDEYDLYYYHLILWDHTHSQLVGAYRMGRGKEILEFYGKKGFYMNTLFKMSNEFKPYLFQSMELGRSFVVPHYQKQRWPLFLLWQGITLCTKNFSEVKYLVGPVTMSDSYKSMSKHIIIQFLEKNYGDAELAAWVKPRVKVKKIKAQTEDAEVLLDTIKNDIKKVDRLIGEIEPMGLQMPVLYKKYLAQNAKIISFNRDPLFNDAIDAFMILDIERMPQSELSDKLVSK
ncbi:MAG: lysophospholipid acyltransferase family protein [Bacteroidetes bacterium]|nr:lysophospholipid acyltransferase family protein [Bacteroidota bacterium]